MVQFDVRIKTTKGKSDDEETHERVVSPSLSGGESPRSSSSFQLRSRLDHAIFTERDTNQYNFQEVIIIFHTNSPKGAYLLHESIMLHIGSLRIRNCSAVAVTLFLLHPLIVLLSQSNKALTLLTH
jgi:hypothetical protein